MDLRLFDPILDARLGELYESARKALEREELLKITPVAAQSVLLCKEADRALAAERVRERIASTGGQALRDKCPALTEAERIIRQNHTAMAEEFSSRFECSREKIARGLFGLETVSDPTALEAVGDVHNGGRQTLTVTLAEGKLLYKPRPCRADQALADLVSAYFSDILAVPRCVDQGDYGFCEFIVSVPAASETEAALFYRRMGGLAALAHAIGISDLHCENILVAGGKPVPVDMETLLTPRPPADASRAALSAFRKAFDRSVYPCCILPCLQDGFQFSPLLSDWKNNRSMPVIGGKRRDVIGFEQDFLDGFLEVYDRCAGLKEELTAFVRRLGEVPVRQLLHPTEEYARFIRKLNRPINAGASGSQEALLSEWVRQAGSFSDRTARMEAESMRARDIPCFYVTGSSRDLYSGGQLAAARYSEASGTEEALLRIGRLGPEDRAFEERIIRGSFYMALIPEAPAGPEPAVMPDRLLRRDEALSAAARLLEQLEADAFPDPEGQWNLLRQFPDREGFGPCGVDFGSGLSGLLVFLLAAEKALGRVSPVARRLHENCLIQLDSYLTVVRSSDAIPAPGLSKGLGGILTADLLTGGALLPAPTKAGLFRVTDDALSRWTSGSSGVWNGLAGLLTALCRTADQADSSDSGGASEASPAGPLAVRTAELLLEQAARSRQGSGRILSGFGAGQAGIGAALLAACRRADDPRLLRAAADAFQSEHESFSPALPGWPDLRRSPVPETDTCSIAAGTPGVAMALRLAAEAGLPGAREDLDRALDVLKAKPLLTRDGLAEGNSGLAEALLTLGERDAAGRVLAAMLDRSGGVGGLRFTSPGWRAFRIPGFLDGLAGVGCVLLRYACPESLPALFL